MAKTRMKIIAAPGRVIRPGDDIACRIHVDTDRPIQVHEGMVRLEGEARSVPFDVYATLASSGGFAEGAMVASVYDKLGVAQRFSITCLAFRHRVVGNPSPLILQGGSSWDQMVNITVPSRAPDTWDGNRGRNGSVKYRVVAKIGYHKLDANQQPVGTQKDLTQEVEVLIKNFVDVRDFRPVGPASDRIDRLVRGMWGSSGEVKCELVLPVRGFALGDAIPAVVQINNQSPRDVRKASLTLFQELTFTDSTSPSRPHRASFSVREKLNVLPLARVAPGDTFHRTVSELVAPPYGLTSGSFLGCSCISVRFIVRLKVKWYFGSVEMFVNIILGNRRPGDGDDNPGDGDGKFPDLRCRSEALNLE